jgi:integrase
MSKVLKIRAKRHGCYSYFSEDRSLLILPTLFSMHLSKTGCGWVRTRSVGKNGCVETNLELKHLSETTQNFIHHRIVQFLNWLSHFDKVNNENILHMHHNLPASFINDYVNDFLIVEKNASEIAVAQHISALRHYYNYLAVAELATHKNIYVKPELKEATRQNTRKRTAPKYLSKTLRLLLYRNAGSLRDEILLRNGGELGLRAKENLGLVLNDFKVGNKTKHGIKTLWRLMNSDKSIGTFTYYLQGKFTKAARGSGGISREIFIPRQLLEKYLKYYEKERPSSNSEYLFLNNSPSVSGMPIQPSKASDVFAKIRGKLIGAQSDESFNITIQKLESDHTYHCLRHSFATDKFEIFCKEDGVTIENVTPDHRPFLRLAILMGHSVNAKTTRRYIHSVIEKQNIVNMDVL